VLDRVKWAGRNWCGIFACSTLGKGRASTTSQLLEIDWVNLGVTDEYFTENKAVWYRKAKHDDMGLELRNEQARPVSITRIARKERLLATWATRAPAFLLKMTLMLWLSCRHWDTLRRIGQLVDWQIN
jgi:hypothetical protein